MKKYFCVAFGAVVLLFIGIIYAWSIIAAPISADFPAWSSAKLSFTFTLCMLSFCIGGYVRGKLADKVSIRAALWLAAVLYADGLFLAAQTAESIWLLYVGFGIMCGLATGLVYNAVMGAVTPLFPDKSGTISGVLLMGFGFGGFSMGKLYQSLLSALAIPWREIFMILAAVIFILLFLAGVLLQPKKNTASAMNAAELTAKDKCGRDMLQTRAFQLYFVWVVLLVSAGYMVIGHGKGIILAADGSISGQNVATLVGIISIFNGLGRMFFGALYDKYSFKLTMRVINAVFLVAVVLISMGLYGKNIWLIGAGFVASGMFFAGAAALNSAFISDFFGMRYYAENFAIANLNVLISSFGSTIAGAVYDAKGSYLFVTLMMAVIWFMAVAAASKIKRPTETEADFQSMASGEIF